MYSLYLPGPQYDRHVMPARTRIHAHRIRRPRRLPLSYGVVNISHKRQKNFILTLKQIDHTRVLSCHSNESNLTLAFVEGNIISMYAKLQLHPFMFSGIFGQFLFENLPFMTFRQPIRQIKRFRLKLYETWRTSQ